MTKPNISAISPVVTAVFVLVLTALSLLTFQTQSMAQTNSISSTAASVSGAQSSSSNSLLSLKTIFKQVQNSIVQITSKAQIPISDPSNPQAQNATALGSGFVYDKQEHIITNNHVVGNAKIVDVTFLDGNRYTAKVIGTDIYSDIAVIQIQNITQPQQQSLPSKPLVIGNSSKLEVGDPVIAIGNPFGLTDTLTTGIVSGVGRLLPSEGADWIFHTKCNSNRCTHKSRKFRWAFTKYARTSCRNKYCHIFWYWSRILWNRICSSV